MRKPTFAQAAARLARRIDQLARISDESKGTTRTFLSPAMLRANALVGGWMREAGLSVRVDTAGNLVGRIEAPVAGARTLLLGSHLDTVRDAGRFDGTLGVLLAVAAVEFMRASGAKLPFAVEVVGFSEEEGVRFSSAYLGSKAYAGRLRASDLKLRDSAGISAAQVLATHNGGRFSPPRAAHSRGELIGYIEVHIEQGPVLESLGRPAGVVSAIAGQTRAAVVFGGSAGHAGTTPMAMRRDAVAGAAEFVLAVEALARKSPPLVATVGKFAARPGAANVIAGSAELSLDVRHPVDAGRLSAFSRIERSGRAIAKRRRLSFSMRVLQENGAVPCSTALTSLLAKSVRRQQGDCPSLPSGAGHDAVVISSIAPVAMLFVRCRAGLSHHPDEFVHPRDLEAALRIIVDFMASLSSRSEK